MASAGPAWIHRYGWQWAPLAIQKAWKETIQLQVAAREIKKVQMPNLQVGDTENHVLWKLNWWAEVQCAEYKIIMAGEWEQKKQDTKDALWVASTDMDMSLDEFDRELNAALKMNSNNELVQRHRFREELARELKHMLGNWKDQVRAHQDAHHQDVSDLSMANAMVQESLAIQPQAQSMAKAMVQEDSEMETPNKVGSGTGETATQQELDHHTESQLVASEAEVKLKTAAQAASSSSSGVGDGIVGPAVTGCKRAVMASESDSRMKEKRLRKPPQEIRATFPQFLAGRPCGAEVVDLT